jgi:hypothetical protein
MGLARVAFLVVMTIVGSCASDDVVDGPAQADLDNEAPYGPGVVVGETYDYVLYTHCGVQWARVDGVWWESELLDDGNANPPEDWGNPYDKGQLTVIDGTTAEYTGGPGATVRFERTGATEPPFACE